MAMHRPPAVSWDVRPARWQRRLTTALALCAALAWAGFSVRQGWGAASPVLLLVLVVSVLLSIRAGRNAPVGQLRWDGEQWHWSGADDGAVRSITCVWDLQVLLLLKIHFEPGAQQWLWLEAGAEPARWRAMRRALVAATSISGSQPNQKRRA